MKDRALRARVCALCGRDHIPGDGILAMSLLVKWAREAGINLKAVQSDYLHSRCSHRLRRYMQDEQAKARSHKADESF